MSTNLDTKIASEPHPALLIADYLEEHGWVQGHFEDFGGGACCISGAGRKIFGDDVYYGNIYPRVRQLLSMGVHMSVSEWNDAEGRTYEEVITVLRGGSDGR